MLLSMHPTSVPLAEGLPLEILIVGRDEGLGLLARGVGDGGGGLNCNKRGGRGGQSVITDCPANNSIFKNRTRNTSIIVIVCNSNVQ